MKSAIADLYAEGGANEFPRVLVGTQNRRQWIGFRIRLEQFHALRFLGWQLYTIGEGRVIERILKFVGCDPRHNVCRDAKAYGRIAG